jgi:hypothetical protein
LNAARAWQEHADGETLDPKAFAALRPLLGRLKVSMAALDQAMLEAVTRDELHKRAVVELASAIEKAHGTSAGSSFQVGTSFAAIARSLKTGDGGTIAPAALAEIADQFAKLSQAAEAAGFGEGIDGFIEAYSKIDDPGSADGAVAARKLCGEMIAKLADLEQVSRMSRP